MGEATYVRCPGRTAEGVEMSRETVRIVIVACLVSGARGNLVYARHHAGLHHSVYDPS